MNPERSEELVEGKAVISSSIDRSTPLPAVGEKPVPHSLREGEGLAGPVPSLS